MQEVELKKKEVPYAINEEIKYLRTNIQFSGTDKKVIMLTSCLAGEGKSTLSLLLAKSLEELGNRVLLIDADLRRSYLKKQLEGFDGKNSKGLTHLLSGMVRVEDVLVRVKDSGLYIILAGPVPPNPSELLACRHVDGLLNWAKENFDYVLIDTAPLGTVIDAAVLAPKCDGVALVIEAGKIPYRVAQGVVHQLRDSGCPLLGVILNKVETTTNKKYYSRYYRRYYSRYYSRYYRNYEYTHDEIKEKQANLQS